MMRVLVTGASGFLGSHVVRFLRAAGHEVTGTFHEHGDILDHLFGQGSVQAIRLDLTDGSAVESAFRGSEPDVVVHTAAMADIRPCEEAPDLARRVNVDASLTFARLCRDAGSRLIFFSTDQVFDGEEGDYGEDHAPNPLHVYGRTKAEAERVVLDTMGERATVVRVALTFGESPSGGRSCTEQVARALKRGERPRLFKDEIRTPVFAKDVASCVGELVEREEALDRLHLGGPEALSRHEIGCAAAKALGFDPSLIDAVKQKDLNLDPPRPRDLSMNTSRVRRILKRPPRSMGACLGLI